MANSSSERDPRYWMAKIPLCVAEVLVKETTAIVVNSTFAEAHPSSYENTIEKLFTLISTMSEGSESLQPHQLPMEEYQQYVDETFLPAAVEDELITNFQMKSKGALSALTMEQFSADRGPDVGLSDLSRCARSVCERWSMPRCVDDDGSIENRQYRLDWHLFFFATHLLASSDSHILHHLSKPEILIAITEPWAGTSHLLPERFSALRQSGMQLMDFMNVLAEMGTCHPMYDDAHSVVWKIVADLRQLPRKVSQESGEELVIDSAGGSRSVKIVSLLQLIGDIMSKPSSTAFRDKCFAPPAEIVQLEKVSIAPGTSMENDSLVCHVARLWPRVGPSQVGQLRHQKFKAVEVEEGEGAAGSDGGSRPSSFGCLLCGMITRMGEGETCEAWRSLNECVTCGYHHAHHVLAAKMVEISSDPSSDRDTNNKQLHSSGDLLPYSYASPHKGFFLFILEMTKLRKPNQQHSRCLISDVAEFIITRGNVDQLTSVDEAETLEFALQCLDRLTEGNVGDNCELLLAVWSSDIISALIKFINNNEDITLGSMTPGRSYLDEERRAEMLERVFRILGNFVLGSDQMTQAVLDYGLLKMYRPILHHPDARHRAEAAWSLSNILAGTDVQVEMALQAGLLVDVFHLFATDSNPKVVREVAWCVANVLQSARTDDVDYALSVGALEAIELGLRRLSHPLNYAHQSGKKALVEVINTLHVVFDTHRASFHYMMRRCPGLAVELGRIMNSHDNMALAADAVEGLLYQDWFIEESKVHLEAHHEEIYARDNVEEAE